jgi:predicted enzyme related to lactoylglutathione lyase
MRATTDWLDSALQPFERLAAFYQRIFAGTSGGDVAPGTKTEIFAVAAVRREAAVTAHARDHGARVGREVGTGASVHGSGGIDAILRRVDAAGGRVLVPRIDLGGRGFIAVLTDTEGNVMGLHQPR